MAIISYGVSATLCAQARPKAVVYRGPASSEGCPEGVRDLLVSSPSNFEVVFAGPNEPIDCMPMAADRTGAKHTAPQRNMKKLSKNLSNLEVIILASVSVLISQVLLMGIIFFPRALIPNRRLSVEGRRSRARKTLSSTLIGLLSREQRSIRDGCISRMVL
ncbi:hypothetical protein LB503_012122 [Fusarium chuoi]|nr:hypothetical protein LB503_012122 [Fusarium chuoi]